jgi:hypothetical protein
VKCGFLKLIRCLLYCFNREVSSRIYMSSKVFVMNQKFVLKVELSFHVRRRFKRMILKVKDDYVRFSLVSLTLYLP